MPLPSEVKPTPFNHNCRFCASFCYAPDGQACMVDPGVVAHSGEGGGLLVVSDYPTERDLAAQQIFGSVAGAELRSWFEKFWGGEVYYAYALKCQPDSEGQGYEGVAACRGYLQEEIKRVKPSRIVALGPLAFFALSGVRAPGLSGVPGGYTRRRAVFWLPDQTPVLATIHPKQAFLNRFIKQALCDDVQWACSASLTGVQPFAGEVVVVTTALQAKQAEERAVRHGEISLSVIVSGIRHEPSFSLLMVALCIEERVYLWPQASLSGDASLPLRAMLKEVNLRKSIAGAKEVIGQLAGLGFEVQGLWADPLLLARLLDTNAPVELSELAWRVGMGGYDNELEQRVSSLVQRLQGKERVEILRQCSREAARAIERGERADYFVIAAVPKVILCRSAAAAVVSVARLTASLYEQICAPDTAYLWKNAWRKILGPVSESLAAVEEWGVLVDRGAIEQFASFLRVRVGEVERRLAVFGLTEPGAGGQVQRYLYDHLKLRVTVRTATGQPSTEAEVLEAASQEHPELVDLLEWRRLNKLLGTYALSLLRSVRSGGRVHSTFHIMGASTLRLSSSDPNLQNLPNSDGTEASLARNCIIASPGWVLLDGDYDQQELRLAANFAGDQAMLRVFQAGLDFYRETAAMLAPLIWGGEFERFTSFEQQEKRNFSKRVVLGLIYGMGVRTLAGDLRITREQAQRVVDVVLSRYLGLRRWIEESQKVAAISGYCTTQWEGEPLHARVLWDIGGADRAAEGSALRSSYNTRLQGSGAAFIMATVNEMVRWIRYDGVPAKLISTVHDSVILEVRKDALAEVSAKLKRTMEGFDNGACPLVAKLSKGASLGRMELYEVV